MVRRKLAAVEARPRSGLGRVNEASSEVVGDEEEGDDAHLLNAVMGEGVADFVSEDSREACFGLADRQNPRVHEDLDSTTETGVQ